jgi:hypothetical protein
MIQYSLPYETLKKKLDQSEGLIYLTDSAITLLGIHSKEMQQAFQRDICTPMPTIALFTTTNIWNNSRCPSIDVWIKEMWYIYAMEYYSAIKKKFHYLQQNG